MSNEEYLKSLVSLGDVSVVHDWLEKNKVTPKIKVKLDGDIIVAECDFDSLQTVLISSFCMALRSGELAQPIPQTDR